jgi:hypothetical protein
MARPFSPWRRRGYWFANIGGKQVPLCPDTESKSRAKQIGEDKRSEYRKAHPVVTGTCLTVRELLDAYLAQHVCAPATDRKYREHFKTLLGMIGDKQASRVSHLDADAWRKRIAGLKGSSANGMVKSARAVWAWAVSDTFTL